MTVNMPQQFNAKEYESGRKLAMGLGSAVYAGGVIVVTTLNISFILLALPTSSYFTRFIMVVGSVLVGLSMLAFPIATHKWAISGWHRWLGLFLYYGEIAIVAINTIVSFATLLYKFGGAAVPDWVGWYEPYSIAATIYTIVAWGTLWVTDPRARQQAKTLDALERFNSGVATQLNNYLETEEGKAHIQDRANSFIDANFRTLQGGPVFWNQNNNPQANWACSYCNATNPGTSNFCSSCGAQRPVVNTSRPILPPAQQKACPACGSSNAMSAAFCQSCGTSFISAPLNQPPAPLAPPPPVPVSKNGSGGNP